MKAWSRVRNTLTELSGRSGRQFADLLGEQVAATLAGAELVRDGTVRRHPLSPGDVHDEMADIEHRGDAARRRLVEQLSLSLVTPIDREDLFRLSRAIDDVLDNLRDFAREDDLFQVADRHFAEPIVDALIEGIDGLATAVDALDGTPENLTEVALVVRRDAGQVRRLYHRTLATLFEGPIDGEAMRKQELLHRLEVVGRSLGEAADALADGAVKREQ